MAEQYEQRRFGDYTGAAQAAPWWSKQNQGSTNKDADTLGIEIEREHESGEPAPRRPTVKGRPV